MMSLVFSTLTQESRMIAALVAAPGIYLVGLALGRWLKRHYNVPFGVAYHWFILLLTIYTPLKVWHVINYDFANDADGKPMSAVEVWHITCIRGFGSLVIILAILAALALMRRFFWEHYFHKRYGTHAPKLLQQVFGFGIFCTSVLLLLKGRHGVAIDAFLAGSGIVAVVVGFAMQETLANIVSGIALQIGKPFQSGDWLIVTDIRAEVIEVNWRSTRLRTNDDVYLDIPNKTIVTSTITNLSFPTKSHANRMRVGFEYGTPPNIVREILRRSAEDVALVLTNPPVKVFLKDFADSAIVYEIKYSIEDDARFNDIEDAIRTNIWYEASRAGLTIPFPQRVVHVTRDKPNPTRNIDELRERARKLELLSPLSEAQREHLLENANVLRFERGERIIKQGSDGCSMFVILHGELDVFITKDGRDTQVATLHDGDAFGEMCMLTGEARSATVRAKKDSLVWEIRRSEMQPLLQENAEMAARMSELLARRKMHTEGILAAQAPTQVVQDKTKEYANGVLGKIRALFKI